MTRLWLRENVADNPLLLHHAGRAAELSGDWRGAVALYQQYLTRADLQAKTAENAVSAVYSLLIDHLADEEGAYAYMAKEGNRLHGCGRAVQLDPWFLDRAVRRKDHRAVAARLLDGPEVEPFVPVPFVWSDQFALKIQAAGTIRPDDDLFVAHGSLEERRFVGTHAGPGVVGLVYRLG